MVQKQTLLLIYKTCLIIIFVEPAGATQQLNCLQMERGSKRANYELSGISDGVKT